jgi:PAS domain S-box-containing protein
VEHNSVVIDEYFSIIVGENATALHMALLPISLDINLQRALITRDVNALNTNWKFIFSAMQQSQHITHFSFLDAHRTVIIRFHDMARKGDIVERTTLLKAEQSGKTSWGIEVGSFGTITLRVVQPVYEGGILVGYIEIGQDIASVMNTLHVILKNDLAIFVHKEYVEQNIWEKNTHILGKNSHWDEYSQSVLLYSSIMPLSKSLGQVVEYHQDGQHYQVSVDEKEWIAYAIPLHDIKGEEIGDMLVMQDITNETESFIHFILKSSLIGGCLFLLVAGFIYLLLRQTNKSFSAQEEALSRIEKIASRIPGVVYQYRLRPDGSSSFPFASDAIEQIYRVSAKEVMEDASKVFRILHPEDFENIIDSINQSAKNLTPWKLEYRVQFDDGTVRWLLGNAIPEKEKDGSTLWHGFIDDITEQKALEYKLKKMNELLDIQVEKEVAHRMKIQKEQEVERQFLVQKSKLSSMGEMMGAIAHQWRQPLNALNINIQNLDDDFDEGLVDKAFINKFIEKNKKTIHFMSRTIDDFRNFFKIDKEKKEFSLRDAISETLSLQSAQFENRNIHVDLEGEDKKFYGFKGEFQQVILNIINNAKDAIIEQKIKEGRIRIILDDKSIVIEDNAGGIKAEMIERIFEPYFTTKDQGEGTGIGLYMSKMIVEKNMGGRLMVENVSQGAKFTILYGF